MIKKLSVFLNKYKLFVLLSPLSVIIEVLLEIRIPFIMARIVDIGIPSKDIGFVLKNGGQMALMALIALLFGALSAKFAATAAMGFGSELRKGIFNKIQDFSFSNIDKFSTASLITRLTTDVNNTQNTFMMMIRVFVRAPVMLVSATIMAYSINKKLVRIFLIAVPVLSVFFVIIAKVAFPRFNKLLKKYDNLNASVQENLIAIRVVKAYVRAKYEKMKFKTANDNLTNAALRAENTVIFGIPLMQATIYFCIVSILWFGGNMVIAGTLKTGELISFISYVTQILMSLMMISMVLITLILSRASVGRILEVLEEKPDITDDNIINDIKVRDGSVEFENVYFKYDMNASEYTLEDINFKIESGQLVGIIGGTGSSKTTLVQLILRLYDVMSGSIKVGGADVRKYKLKTLRDSAAIVLQNNVLFSGTIKENLLWGNIEATDEQIINACQIARAHDFIMSFPNGYETVLGQGGVNLSGGQKQRLCIARALLKEPKILILDDSTSAVDTATDLKIREALRKHKKDITTIIIAQRISSLSDADKIIVLDEGKINDIGTNEELLNNNRIYKEVYYSQLKGVNN